MSVISRNAVRDFTDPGDTVFDPECSDSIIVGEAAQMKRKAIGIITHEVTATRIAFQLGIDGAPWVRFHVADKTILQRVTDGRNERIRLNDLAMLAIVAARPAPVRREKRADYSDPFASEPAPHRAFLAALRNCKRALHPNGVVVVYAPRRRIGGELVDVPGMAVAALRRSGFTPIDRIAVTLHPSGVVAPVTAIGDDESPERTAPGRRPPAHRRIHEDLIVATVTQ